MAKLDLPTILGALKSLSMNPEEKARLIVETLCGQAILKFLAPYERGMGQERFVAHCRELLLNVPTITPLEAITTLEGAGILTNHAPPTMQ